MQSFVVQISQIAGLKNKVANRLSRLGVHFMQQKGLLTSYIEEDHIKGLLFPNLEFSEEDIPLELLECTDGRREGGRTDLDFCRDVRG